MSGAVIVEHNGRRMKYRQKCEKCGQLATTVIQIGAPMGSNKLTTTFKCSTNGSQQRVEIAGR